MNLITVIVPAYNAEDTLARCLDSLVAQTYKNLEVIIVNDGSKDNTAAIADSYAQKDPEHFFVIHQENQGLSGARNTGMDHAHGDYLAFIDSDDYVANTIYEEMIHEIIKDDSDLCACATSVVYPNKEIIVQSGFPSSNQNVSKALMVDAYTVVWNKLYKASLLKDIRFVPRILYEDVVFLFELYPKIKRVCSIDLIGVYYVQNLNSISYQFNAKLYQLIDNMDSILAQYQNNGWYETYRDELEYSYVRYLYGTFMKRFAKTKNYKLYMKESRKVKEKVTKQFPNYKHNLYLKRKGLKASYFRYYNSLFARIIYFIEKDKMN